MYSSPNTLATAGDSGEMPLLPVSPIRVWCARDCRREEQLRRRAAYGRSMCRNIRTLHNFEPSASTDEVRAAALQYVRKIAGTTKPSKANQEAFDRAVEAIAHATQHLLDELVTTAPPKNREAEAAKARERAERSGRYATAN